MICDCQTNKVYLAEGIRHYENVAHNLLLALYNEGMETEFLRHTDSWKHIWARDYMPIQLTKTRFLQYRYAPDYLKGYEDYIPPYQTICEGMRLKRIETPLVIDGGNVVKFRNCVVMTDKVLKENPGYTERYIRQQLEEAFGCEIVLIPWDRYEMFGHADGMVRAIGDYYILMNNYCDFDRDLKQRLRDALSGRFCIAELHYDVPRPSRLSWAYLNFLQVNNCIFVPGLGVREDEKAVEQIQEHYPRHKVILVPGCQELVREGGALNCISWSILADRHHRKKENVC